MLRIDAFIVLNQVFYLLLLLNYEILLRLALIQCYLIIFLLFY